MRSPVLLVAGAMCLVALVAGLWLGAGQVRLSETDVINAMADRYVAETGGARTDCAAIPGDGAVWLVVRCQGAGAAVREFEVDRRGAVIASDAAEPSA